MEQMILKAVTTATDKGTFTAVISSASTDRDGDIVEPSAIVKALGKWAALGKLVPLAYSHRDPKTGQSVVVGHIDPASARVQGKEVITTGWVDQGTERGAETWRLVKSGTLSFSYGYLVPEGGATKRAGKQRGSHVTAIDLYEVSVVPVGPANNDTRVLGWKAMATGAPLHLLQMMIAQAQEYIDNAPDPEDATEMRGILDDLKELVADVDDAADQAEDQDEDGKALRRRAERVERENREGRFPKLGAAPPVESAPASAPEPPTPPDAERQRRKAAQLEQEQKQHDRQAEANALPNLGPPPPEPTPLPVADPPQPPDAAEQRRKASAIEREQQRQDEERQLPDIPAAPPEYALLRISHEEMGGLADGALKAVWSAAFEDSLPDSAFLYVEPGGTKDSDGRTVPRSLRHFPYKNDAGQIDMPHLRNALGRIPQSNLSPAVKDELTAKAQRILDGQKSLKVDGTDQEAQGLRSVDPLRARAQAVELEFASGGESRRKPPAQKDAPTRRPELALDELRQRTRDETLIALSGVDQI